MTDDAGRVAEAATRFLEERDDGEAVLEAVLAVDAEHETWTFDDVALDSGTFGEIVSRDLVEKHAGAYRLVEPEVVAAVVAGEEIESASASDGGSLFGGSSFDLGRWGDRRAMAGLLGALAVLFVLRILNYRSVFQDGHVVSPANDPYHYRYWMETLLADSEGITDYGVITDLPSGPDTRPLTHATNWVVAELLGGDQWAAEMVAAWLPVVATLALGVVLFWLAVVVTDDVRVGLAAVVLLALAPVHAVYAGLGFLEHRLHQYLWLGVTLLTLAWLAADLARRRDRASSDEAAVRGYLRSGRTWLAVAGLGLSLAASAHTWSGSVLVFIPLAAYIALKVAVDVRAGLSPIAANGPLAVGVALGGALAAAAHLAWGWHEPYAGFVPLLVAVGTVGVIALGAAWRRLGWPVGWLVGAQGVLGAGGLVAFRGLQPEVWSRLYSRADDLLAREGYLESISLFTVEQGIIFGPLSQIGVGFYLGIAVLGWACVVAYRRYEPAWLLLVVYTGFWLILAAYQVRFAAQLVLPLSVLGGLGFVHLLAWVDLARVPRPFREVEPSRSVAADGGEAEPSLVFPDERAKVGVMLGVVLLVCGLSLIFVPSLTAQVAYDDAQLDAALAIEDHAEETDREWRENAVFSTMGDNRMYNYFVSGESRQYRYVDSWYGDYVHDNDPDGWTDQLDGRFGYVIADADEGLHPELLGADGERTLSHYQLLSLSEDESVAAFAIVEGATITGEAEPDETLVVETDVEADGASFTDERVVTADADGEFSVTVPYAGEYDVGGQQVTVSEEDVLVGETVGSE
ncbi:MFS transporter [Halobacteria archaeon AArc-dxtr1]|nr:MFS transporter [Halobacteria archaeon AArc-dxtr1]